MEGNNNFNQNQYQANQTNNFNQEPIYQSNQVLEKKEGSNKILVVALVMSFIAVIALAYFYTDIKNEYIALKAEQVNNPSSCVKPEEDADKKEIKVEELTHIVTEKDENGKRYADIKMPKITGDTNTINSLNKKMLEDLYKPLLSYNEEYEYDYWNLEDENNLGVFYIGTYKYVIKNNVVIIVAKVKVASWNASGNGVNTYIYTYDANTDKEVSLSEALVKMGYTDADFLALGPAGSCYTELDENYNQEPVICTVEIIKKYIDWIKDGDFAKKEWSNSVFDINDNNEIEISIDGSYELI